MSETALSLPIAESTSGLEGVDLESDAQVRQAAIDFCQTLPYRRKPYASRNWGGLLHSLCSYQGKLKPAIAHFLIRRFTTPGEVVLDPMAGVGTIPLEARLQGRSAIAGDLSELAAAVSRAKLEAVDLASITSVTNQLWTAIEASDCPTAELIEEEHGSFGLNGPVQDYFEHQTLREVLLARRFFRPRVSQASSAEAVVLTSLLHILHGNRPYALSRRSHPLTPFKPSGPREYRPLRAHLEKRLDRILEPTIALPASGSAFLADFRSVPIEDGSVDAVITSPPFTESVRFFSSNWMRLWFCGWTPEDFKRRPSEFLERMQKTDFDESYRDFLSAMRRLLRPSGLLIMHLGETASFNMATRIAPLLEANFRLIHVGRECVVDTESHGLSDKGATRAHAFLFARALS